MRKSKHIARKIVRRESVGVFGDWLEEDVDEPEGTESDGEERGRVREILGYRNRKRLMDSFEVMRRKNREG